MRVPILRLVASRLLTCGRSLSQHYEGVRGKHFSDVDRLNIDGVHSGHGSKLTLYFVYYEHFIIVVAKLTVHEPKAISKRGASAAHHGRLSTRNVSSGTPSQSIYLVLFVT